MIVTNEQRTEIVSHSISKAKNLVEQCSLTHGEDQLISPYIERLKAYTALPLQDLVDCKKTFQAMCCAQHDLVLKTGNQHTKKYF